MNCTKIPAKVQFKVKPRSQSKSEGFEFKVFPESAYIQPHAFEYVSVVFKPSDMMTYGGIFEAIVENGEQNPKTHKILFELRGEGTLPTLTQRNAKITDDGRAVLKFPKTRVGKKCVQEISF